VPPAYGGEDGPVTGRDTAEVVVPVDDEDPEPDRYDEPTLDVLAESAAAEPQPTAPEPTGPVPVKEKPAGNAQNGEEPPSTAPVDDQPAGEEAARAAVSRTGPVPADAPAAEQVEPRLADMREAPHPAVDTERVAGYAAGGKAAEKPVPGSATTSDGEDPDRDDRLPVYPM
jgi:hypothetical protein